MIIEILYPRLCCLYGDKGNTMFLQQCFPEAEFIFTELNDKPYFIDNQVDLCCMYSMSEQNQERVLERLMPYKDAISIANTFFLFLGNSMELLGNTIKTEDGNIIDGLGIFDFDTVRCAPKRFNTLIQAQFQDITLLGYTSRFSDVFGITEDIAFCKTIIGCGSDRKNNLEGIYVGNILATYLLGPLLPANPDFTKWLLHKLGSNTCNLPYEDALYTAYETKRKEFQLPDLELE